MPSFFRFVLRKNMSPGRDLLQTLDGFERVTLKQQNARIPAAGKEGRAGFSSLSGFSKIRVAGKQLLACALAETRSQCESQAASVKYVHYLGHHAFRRP
ncbi:MAG: hypothetical protein DMG57_19255 [Acidobacteria bacterium]|nr:MAG: hypothetical protein DMG57_19255 [Acidobacteriota bacterium]